MIIENKKKKKILYITVAVNCPNHQEYYNANQKSYLPNASIKGDKLENRSKNSGSKVVRKRRGGGNHIVVKPIYSTTLRPESKNKRMNTISEYLQSKTSWNISPLEYP